MSNSWSSVPYKTRQHIKSLLIARDGLRCHWCKKRIRTFKDATVEHIKRRKDGGDVLGFHNLTIACAGCNYSQVGARNPVVFVDNRSFFDTESAEHPAPRVYPSPDRSEKTQ